MAIQAIVAYPDRIELIADMPMPVPTVGRAFVPLVRGGAGVYRGGAVRSPAERETINGTRPPWGSVSASSPGKRTAKKINLINFHLPLDK